MKTIASLLRFLASAVILCFISLGSTYMTIQYMKNKTAEEIATQPRASAQPVWQPMDVEEPEIAYSIEQLTDLKKAMSQTDKQTIYGLIKNNIDPDRIEKLSQWIENGVNQFELEEMKRELNKHLTKTEYQKIVEIFRKYGR